MSKRRAARLEERLGPLLAPDEERRALIVTERAPWQFLFVVAMLAGFVAEALSGERGLNLFGIFLAGLCATQMRSIALVATDRAIYLVETKRGSTTPPQAIPAAECPTIRTHALWITVGGRRYWPIVTDLRKAHRELASDLWLLSGSAASPAEA